MRIVVDWDGTLVENAWPAMGHWLPGAIDALRELDELGEVVIFSTRIASKEYPSASRPEDDTDRHPGAVEWEIQGIQKMLADVGLGHIEIWIRDYKPPGVLYIDDHGLRFEGHWPGTMRHVRQILADSEYFIPAETEVAIYDPASEPNAARVEKETMMRTTPWDGDELVEVEDLGPAIPGSPQMRAFDTGATRNQEKDPDLYGFTSPLALNMFGRYMHEHRVQADGQIRDSDNWKQGIPLDSYARSLFRHVQDLRLHHDGFSALAREDLESALSGIFFNVQGYMHEIVKAEIEGRQNRA